MITVKIKASLKKAQLWDFFNCNEDIYQNLPLFYLSQLDGEIHGAYFTHSDSDCLELFLKCSIGMVYKINYKVPGENDIPIKLELQTASADDIKEYSNSLKLGLPYYLRYKDSLDGPFFLSKKSNLKNLKVYLQEKKIYIIKKNQKIQIVLNQNIAV